MYNRIIGRERNPVDECCDNLNVCKRNRDNKVCCGGHCSPTCNTFDVDEDPLSCCTRSDSCAKFNKNKVTCCVNINDPCFIEDPDSCRFFCAEICAF